MAASGRLRLSQFDLEQSFGVATQRSLLGHAKLLLLHLLQVCFHPK